MCGGYIENGTSSQEKGQLCRRVVCLSTSIIASKQMWQKVILSAEKKQNHQSNLRCWLDLHTNKGTLRSCVLIAMLVSSVVQVYCVSIYCFCSGVLAKETDKRYSMSSWFWVDSLITWTSKGQRRADEFCVQGQKAVRRLLDWLKITWSGFYLAISCLNGLDENLLSCCGFNVRFGLKHCL